VTKVSLEDVLVYGGVGGPDDMTFNVELAGWVGPTYKGSDVFIDRSNRVIISDLRKKGWGTFIISTKNRNVAEIFKASDTIDRNFTIGPWSLINRPSRRMVIVAYQNVSDMTILRSVLCEI
jgi:hypothetical protein